MHSAVPIGLSECTNPIGAAENIILPIGLFFKKISFGGRAQFLAGVTTKLHYE